MKTSRIIALGIFGLLALSIIGLACMRWNAHRFAVLSHTVRLPDFSHPVVIGTTTIHAAFAHTEAEREQGLSDTPPLLSDQGMLFFFDAPDRPAFWMKDMRYSLDMIWIGEDKTVKDISANVAPSTYPDQVFQPKEPVQYVLEAPAGFAQAHSITVGTKVSF